MSFNNLDALTIHPDVYAQSGCTTGDAYACANTQPWVINANLSYGFAAANLKGEQEPDWYLILSFLIFSFQR